ncbi:uncharacterized protein [Dysidea avara]|uniref:uncharacterized protein n=1 Tax=Dysidea avara TaxID=196820 RepID=UPI00332EEFBE
MLFRVNVEKVSDPSSCGSLGSYLDYMSAGFMQTGKFCSTTDPSSSRVAWVEADAKKRAVQSSPSYSQYANDDKYWALIDTMKEIAKKHNATVAQIAIAWLLKQPTVTSVILGARTKQQLADNLASVNSLL